MRKLPVLILFSSLLPLVFSLPVSAELPLAKPAGSADPQPAQNKSDKSDSATTTLTAWDFSLVLPNGQLQPLSAYRGKVLLIINLASQSLYASQLPALAQLQQTYASRGLVLLGIPSADFGHQELADPAAVAAWYAKQNLGFLVAAPAKLTGVLAIPLVDFLTTSKGAPPGGPIHWNYTKFLLDRSGHPVQRFEADTDPASPAFAVQLEKLLDQPIPAAPPSASPKPTSPSKPTKAHHATHSPS